MKRGQNIESEERDHWMMKLYKDNVKYMDKQLHRFLVDLKTEKVLEETLIIITSDHGEELNDFGGLYHGWQINPYVMSVPLFVHYPKSLKKTPASGTRVDFPCNLIDITPTIAEVLGVKIKTTLPTGKSLLSLDSDDRNRKFPLLSWQTRYAGMISFDPLVMEVVELNEGQLSTYTKDGDWQISENTRSVDDVSSEINREIKFITSPWINN